MARGYLGKISAIVSANTGDYVRKLNESAASTKRFAQSIQRDLARASADATKSVTGILTPLQRVERALQNAGSQRLRFRGFDGAIRTVEDLSKRLAGLDDDRQINLVVRTSGLDSVNRVKQVIGDLSEEEIDLAINVGGVNGLERLRSQIQEVNGTPVNVQTGVSAARLDELIAKFRVLAPERIRQIQFAVETAQFEKAATALQRTISFSEAVTKSFQQSAQAVSQLPADVQIAFGPAFKQITNELLAFGEQIKEIDPGTQAFNTIAENAKRAEQAIARLVEAQKLVSSGASGEELGFVDPRLRDTLGGSARLRSQAEGSRDPSQFRADVQQLKALDDLASSYFAKLEAGRQAAARGEDAGFDVADVERKLEGVLETSRRTQAELERKLTLEIDADEAEKTLQRIKDLVPGLRDDIALRITGDFQNLEQAEGAAKALVAQIKELDASQLTAFGPQIDKFFAALDSGDIKQIDAAVKELKATIGVKPLELKIDIDAQDLQGKAIDLAQKIQADFDKIVKSLPAGSLPRRRIEEEVAASLSGGPRGGGPSAAQLEEQIGQLDQQIRSTSSELDALRSKSAAFENLQRSAAAAENEIEQVEKRIAELNRQVDSRGDAKALRAPIAQSADDLIERVKGQREGTQRLPQDFEKRLREQFAKLDAESQKAVAREIDLVGRAGFRGDLSGPIEGFLTGRGLGGASRAEIELNKPRDRLTGSAGVFTNLREIEELEKRLAELESRRVEVPIDADTAGLDQQIAEKKAELESLRDSRDSRIEDLRSAPPDRPPRPPDAPPDADLVKLAQAEAERFKELGAAIDDPTRRIDILKSSITSLKGQLDQLPAPVRGQFVAALEEAEQEFLRLKGSATATAEEVERASQKVSELRASASRISSIALTAGSGDAISGIASQEAVGKLQAAQRLLAQVGATAGGPVAQAYDRLREAQLRFVQEGIQNTPRARREIELLERELARAAAQTGKIRMGQAFREIQRGGDIASKSLQRFSLAANQAAFIVDDFFSTTGGAEQKLRAIQNNITQLGFVLASTQGLFIGLGVALAGQLVIAITKYITKADEADRRTKVLNESLASQKNLVEQLARAYEGLAKSIESVGASERGRAAIENRSVANDQRRQEREAGRAAIGATSPVISGRRGAIAKLQEDLEKEIDLVKREILQRSIRDLEGANERLVREVEAAARRLQGQVLRNVRGDPISASTALEDSEAGVVQRLAAASRRGNSQEVDRLSRELATLRVAIISQRGEALRSIVQGDRATGRIGTEEDLSSLARVQQLTAGEGFVSTVADIAQQRINRLFDQFSAGDITLPQLQNDLLNLRNQFGIVFEQVAEQLSAFTDALGRAVTELNKTVESELAQRGDSLRREANQAEARFGADAPQTRFARESQDRVERARAEARDRRLEVESEVSQLRQRFESDAARDAVQARQRGQAPETEAGRIATRIAEAQARLARPQLGPDATADQIRAEVVERDQARQTIERGRAQLADLFDALPQAQELRRRADEGDIAAQRELQDIERRRQSFERGAELAKSPAQKAAEDVEKSFADLNEFFDQRADAVLDRSGGLPDDAAREELRRIEEERRKSTEQLREQALRQTAPLAFQFADEIANAVLQGPSRAALGATDASTTQGQAELNRLIRGQDSARDVNLVELEKQTQVLTEIKEKLNLEVAGA
jgi:hypothetical protein